MKGKERNENKTQIVVTSGRVGRDTKGSLDTVIPHLLVFFVDIWIFTLLLFSELYICSLYAPRCIHLIF